MRLYDTGHFLPRQRSQATTPNWYESTIVQRSSGLELNAITLQYELHLLRCWMLLVVCWWCSKENQSCSMAFTSSTSSIGVS